MKLVAMPVVWAILAGSLLLGCGDATRVETVSAHRGEIRESFTEPARTRLEKTYRIAMPVDGRISRIDLEPGDRVAAGQPLADYDLLPFERALEEARSAVAELEAQLVVKDDNRLEHTALVETEATVRAASEALKASDAEVAAQKARSDRASKELHRIQALAASQAVPETELDDAQVNAETALIDLRKEEFYSAALRALVVAVNLGPRFVNEYIGRKHLERRVLVEQLAQARARLARAEHDLALASIRSPIDGVVLERYEQGDSPLPAGQRLLLLGNLDQLEVVAEVLTQDALRLAPGSAVSLEPASRLELIPGEVERIEPAGFTKLSSLGVEQQRVRVIVAFTGKHEGLGVGYHLQARFFTGSRSDALILPRFSVLQDPDGSFYVLKLTDGRLARQSITLGLRSDLEMEVTAGLFENDRIVAQPDTAMKEGMEVRAARP